MPTTEATDRSTSYLRVHASCDFTLIVARVRVKGTADQPYVVTTINGIPVACTCPDFIFRGHNVDHVCKHMTVEYVKEHTIPDECANDLPVVVQLTAPPN